jgi:hypothetical protein
VYEGLGDGLAEGLRLALDDVDGLAEELALALALELADADVLALADAPALALAEVLAVAVEVALELALAEPLNTVTEEELPEVQAESATQAIMVVRPQPTAVYRTRCDVHAMAVRTLIEPPHALGNDHFPVAARRNRRRKGKRVAGLWSLTAPAGERTGHKDRRP